jgi:long-chain acyl-CoA synthetase
MTNYSKYTIPSLLTESLDKYSGNTSLVFAGENNYTYKQMGEDIKRVAALLKECGVSKGDKVAVLSSNMPNWGIAFFAIFRAGGIAVPILPDFHVKEIDAVIKHSESKVLFISEKEYINLIKGNIKLPGKLILLDNFAVIPPNTKAESLDKLGSSLATAPVNIAPAEIEEDDLASIIYTSGTTGNSKGVMLTHKNVAWTVEQCYKLFNVMETDRFLSVLPLSHTFENTISFLLPVKYGASVHYLRKPPSASVLLPAMKDVKPTVMLVVPLIIEKVFKAKILPKFKKTAVMRFIYSLPPARKILHKIAGRKLYETFGGQLRFFGIGGAKLCPETERFLMEGKFPYAIGYGLTETSPLLAGAVGKNVRLGSTGPAIEGVQMRLADIDLETGAGEIQVRGPNVMRGYYKAPELTKTVFTADGWFKTGDRGIFDKDKFLSVKGRLKNMIVGASGENIYPEEIETVINRMRFVMESLVIEKKGKIVAMIHLNTEEIEQHFKQFKAEAQQYIYNKTDEILKEIQYKVNTELNKFSKLQEVIMHPTPFEKTPTKKIKRFLYV